MVATKKSNFEQHHSEHRNKILNKKQDATYCAMCTYKCTSEVGPDPDNQSRLRPDSAFLFQTRTRCQAKFLISAKFLTCYCFSVILFLWIKK